MQILLQSLTTAREGLDVGGDLYDVCALSCRPQYIRDAMYFRCLVLCDNRAGTFRR